MSIKNMKSIYCVVFILINNKLIAGQSNGACKTPFNEPGFCVPVKECGPLWRLVTQSQKSEKVLNYLKNSVCEDPKLRKMCCRPKDITLDTSNAVPVNAPEMETVMSHPNLKNLDLKNCGPLSSDRIAFGNQTDLYEFPWMALLQYEDGENLDFKCGGSVLNKRYVLTAAHCVANLRRGTRLVSVRLGEYDIDSPTDCQIQKGEEVCTPPVQDIPVERIIAHPGFNKPRFANDVALILLSREADFSDFAVRPICLPVTPQLMNLELKKLTITGWGTTESSRRSSILLKANLPFVEPSTCESALRIKLTPGQFCAGGEGLVDSCGGDSGGPLQFVAALRGTKYVQFGVTSFGVASCGETENKPGVYASTRYYIQWILDNIQTA